MNVPRFGDDLEEVNFAEESEGAAFLKSHFDVGGFGTGQFGLQASFGEVGPTAAAGFIVAEAVEDDRVVEGKRPSSLNDISTGNRSVDAPLAVTGDVVDPDRIQNGRLAEVEDQFGERFGGRLVANPKRLPGCRKSHTGRQATRDRCCRRSCRFPPGHPPLGS